MDNRLTALLHLCDSLFPIGSYAHSDGLEAAATSGRVQDAAGLQAWVDTLIDEVFVHGDGPAARLAWSAFGDGCGVVLRILDNEVYALRPSSTARDASRSVGLRLLTTWQRLHPHPDLHALLGTPTAGRGWTLPVAFGVACASIRVGERAMLEAFLYSRVAATASAAMRLLPIGQIEAHRIVAAAVDRIPGVCDRVLLRCRRPGAFAPLVDIAAMRQQYVRSRLFRS